MTTPGVPHVEIETLEAFDELVRAGATAMAGWRVQALDLTGRTAVLLRLDPAGSLFLGCRLDDEARVWIQGGGGLIFPEIPALPFDPYRGGLYDAAELYDGLERGYEATPDARIYAWYRQHAEHGDVSHTLAAALHDHSIADALDELPAASPGHLWVGVMGGHSIARGDRDYADAVMLGRDLTRRGMTVVTGGGPGAMEAANLGAALAGHDDTALQAALVALARVPSFRPSVADWAAAGLEVRRRLGGDGGVSIPTWFYGHEPPNVFASAIAKYFSNALREDVLLRRARGGIVYLPGAAGTVQEIFQAVTPNYYGDRATQVPMILVGAAHWSEDVPVWRVLSALARDRAMAHSLHLVDSVDEAADLVATAARTHPPHR